MYPRSEDRSARICQEIAGLLEDLSGLELAADQYDLSFLELGFDSLFLTEAAKRYRQVPGQDRFPTIARQPRLDSAGGGISHAQMPRLRRRRNRSSRSKQPGPRVAVGCGKQKKGCAAAGSRSLAEVSVSDRGLEERDHGFVEGDAHCDPDAQQLQAVTQLIQSPLQILGGGMAPAYGSASDRAQLAIAGEVLRKTADGGDGREYRYSFTPTEEVAPETFLFEPPTRDDPGAAAFCGAADRALLHETAKSKSFAQQHRRTLADPRGVSGFRPEWKEMVYSLVSPRSKGSRFWDIDGNEYIDLVNGFGPTMFGHAPDFVVQALQQQIQEGFAIGPQTPLAGKAADLLTKLTGTERVTFCNTGSEAVMAAMRVARTVTGRDRVAFFAGDYHGQFDEVLVKQLKRKGEFLVQPAAPGIPRENLGNVMCSTTVRRNRWATLRSTLRSWRR